MAADVGMGVSGAADAGGLGGGGLGSLASGAVGYDAVGGPGTGVALALRTAQHTVGEALDALRHAGALAWQASAADTFRARLDDLVLGVRGDDGAVAALRAGVVGSARPGAGPRTAIDAAGTVVVLGGRRLTRVDSHDVRVAGGHASRASERLHMASFQVVMAARQLEAASTSSTGGVVPDVASDLVRSAAAPACWADAAVAARHLAALAADARALARRLDVHADDCVWLAGCLLRAAGLYEGSESLVARAAEEALAGIVGGATVVVADLVRRWLPQTDVRVSEVPPPKTAAPWGTTPTGTIATALSQVGKLYDSDDGTGFPPGTIGVERVEHADGSASWVVLVPGTESILSPKHPFDGVSDVEVEAFHTAETTVAVDAALAAAGARPDEAVVLVGHSLGGITAMALAESAAFRRGHPVKGVVTAGSPIVGFRTPDDLPVLHLEHTDDLVPKLDGRGFDDNPRSEHRVTVTRKVAASPDPRDRAVTAEGGFAPHGLDVYGRTLEAGLASGNVQLRGVVDEIEPYLAGTTSDTRFYAATRVLTGPPPALTELPLIARLATGDVITSRSPGPDGAPLLGTVAPLSGTVAPLSGTVAPLSGGGPSSARGG